MVLIEKRQKIFENIFSGHEIILKVRIRQNQSFT